MTELLTAKSRDMKIKNFATFGLFKDGRMIDSGSIHRMENEALRMIMGGQAEVLRISVYGFNGDTVIEKTPVLSYREVNGNILISNMLLEEENEKDNTY